MTDPTPTRAEVERCAASFLRSQHEQLCFEQGDHKDEVDTAYSLGADANERCAALRERAEAAERERDGAVQWRNHYRQSWLDCRDALTAARRAEAAAWNDAIEAAAQRVGDLCKFDARKCDAEAIRALRRAAPTEDR